MRNSIILLIVSTIAISEVSTEPLDCIGSCLDADIPYIPHKICTKYCVCDHGRPVEMSCPAELHFSPENHVCMNPVDAECEGETVSAENTKNIIFKNSSITSNNIYDNNSKRNTKTVPLKSSCLGECGSSINYLAHEDTDKFCLCYLGNKIIMECQSGAYFVPQLNNCIKGTDLEKHDVRREKCIGSCLGNMQPDVIYLLPHENCNRYCLCIAGYPLMIHSCPLDMLFSWPEKKCLDPKLAKCANPDYNPRNFHLSFY